MPYQLSGEMKKCEKITSHLCRRLSVFCVLFLLCTVFQVASYETDHNFLWGQRLFFLKEMMIIKIIIKITLQLDLHWKSLTSISHRCYHPPQKFLQELTNLTNKQE